MATIENLAAFVSISADYPRHAVTSIRGQSAHLAVIYACAKMRFLRDRFWFPIEGIL
jgi:hypothetical protein